MGPGLILLETLLVLLLGPHLVPGAERRFKTSAARFLYQRKGECHFANGTRGEVRYLDRTIYDSQELVRFDSRRGTFEALTPLGEGPARQWNSRKEYMEALRAQVDAFCRYNYGVLETGQMVGREAQPSVKISHTKAGPRAHHSLLICTAAGYYPSEINVKWLKNGQEQTEGLGYADELRNGDWTFQNQVMLEMVPQWGDLYACQVEHSSLKEPITIQWVPEMSDSAKSKMWTGGMGALLGVVFGAVAISLYLKNKKAVPTAPAVGLIG